MRFLSSMEGLGLGQIGRAGPALDDKAVRTVRPGFAHDAADRPVTSATCSAPK